MKDNGCATRAVGFSVVGQFAVAALSERRKFLRLQARRSETAATEAKLIQYRFFGRLSNILPSVILRLKSKYGDNLQWAHFLMKLRPMP
jgi:hypothetical protein